MIIDPRHPFPNLRNGNLYVTCTLDGADEKGLLGIVEVPTSLGRVIKLPSTEREYRYILMEDAMLGDAERLLWRLRPPPPLPGSA